MFDIEAESGFHLNILALCVASLPQRVSVTVSVFWPQGPVVYRARAGVILYTFTLIIFVHTFAICTLKLISSVQKPVHLN